MPDRLCECQVFSDHDIEAITRTNFERRRDIQVFLYNLPNGLTEYLTQRCTHFTAHIRSLI